MAEDPKRDESSDERDDDSSASDDPGRTSDAGDPVGDKADQDESDEDESDEDESDEDESAQDEDEDEDDEDDEDEPPPPPKPSKAKKPAAREESASPRRKVIPAKPAKRPPRPELPPEDVIDTPSRQTLGMMGAMALATLVMWGSAKLACNAHPAQTRKPRDVTTAELAKDPKGAALEMAQRWAAYDFGGALELASGPAAEAIDQAKSACDANASQCEAKRKALEPDRALATAELLAREGTVATVRVTGLGGALEGKTQLYEVELSGPTWKVARPTDVAPTPPTPAPPPMLEPADAGSGGD